jgi:hypothetical protein
MASDLPLLVVEMYTPGEIVAARRPFGAETAADALLAAKGWINDRRRDSTNLRVVDLDGTILFDELVAKFN